MTAGQSLAPLFAPRSVAIVGASSEPTRIGGRPIAYMKERGFKGLILPVNPNRTEIQGLRCYQINKRGVAVRKSQRVACRHCRRINLRIT